MCIIDVPVEECGLESDVNEMTDEQERNAQAEQELRNLGLPMTKMPTLIKRPKPQQKMRGGRRVEQHGPKRTSPPPRMVLQSGLHRVVGDISERMVREMRQQIGEEDETAEDPHLPNADPADKA